MVYMLNAFSLGMLPEREVMVKVKEISLEEARRILQSGFESAVGHESTAQLLSQLLGFTVSANRVAIKLKQGDRAVVFQLLTRLPEGKVLTREELEKIPYKFYLVEVS